MTEGWEAICPGGFRSNSISLIVLLGKFDNIFVPCYSALGYSALGEGATALFKVE